MFYRQAKMIRSALALSISIPALAFVTTENLAAANEDESKVPEYTLPDPLVSNDGKSVDSGEAWKKVRRPEVLKLFQEHVYGKAPKSPGKLRFEELKPAVKAFDGKAERKEVRVFFGDKDQPSMDLLIYRPAGAKKKVPAFMGLNFRGNHTVEADAGITLSESWMPNRGTGIENNRATEKSRGASSSRWPVESIVSRGYGLITIYCGDIDPDTHDGFKNGVHPLFYKDGQTAPGPGEWASISAWAWGLSRALDYLGEDDWIDESKVAVIGHSRLGKTALWAGASDEKFALTISNNSGCGGAALSRREFGETVKRINTSFPHWFCSNFHPYGDDVNKLPVDQHMLIALMAPRPVYVASASKDLWADPKGEFLSLKGAEGVYSLFGLKGLPTDGVPETNSPVTGDAVGYHIREGKHDITEYDWGCYMDFADRFLK